VDEAVDQQHLAARRLFTRPGIRERSKRGSRPADVDLPALERPQVVCPDDPPAAAAALDDALPGAPGARADRPDPLSIASRAEQLAVLGLLNRDFLDSFSPTTTVGVCRDSTDELGNGKHRS
jgi:hypothetical protein